jgi:hypothetical protein
MLNDHLLLCEQLLLAVDLLAEHPELRVIPRQFRGAGSNRPDVLQVFRRLFLFIPDVVVEQRECALDGFVREQLLLNTLAWSFQLNSPLLRENPVEWEKNKCWSFRLDH